jgi:transcriptional regulator with XRE-family HTH domain
MDEQEELRLWKEIGARLRDARLRRKMTLEDVVGALEPPITFGALGHYELGRRPLSLPLAIALADILHVSAAELLGLEEADMTNEELRLMTSFRRLPERDQKTYTDRIEKLAQLYDQPLPDERPTPPRHTRRKHKSR